MTETIVPIERKLLLYIQEQGKPISNADSIMSMEEFSSTARSLDRKGLIKGLFLGGGRCGSAILTDYGKEVLRDNPNLKNEPNEVERWKISQRNVWLIAVVGWVAALASFVVCQWSAIEKFINELLK